MRIERFRAVDLTRLAVQPAQAASQALFADPGYGAAIARGPYAFTVLAGDTVLGCGGMVIEWPGRGVLWSVLSEAAGPHMRAIHRAVLGFLQQADVRRVEMAVDVSFAAGHRWAKMLGMTPEGTMRAYSPDGDDYVLYARIRHD